EARFVDVVDGPADDQHVRIDTTLYVPSAVDAAHPAPAVIGAHGFGQDKRALAADAAFLARRGYVVLLYSARGFGDSTGSVALDSPDYEVKDVRQLVDWLGTRRDVAHDGSGQPRVGMFGESYGGAMALLAAAYDPRIRATVPILTWSSLVRSFLPNDLEDVPPGQGGVFKQAWAGLFLGGIPGRSGRDAAGAALSPCPGFVEAVCRAYVETAVAGQAPPGAVDLLSASSPASVISRIRAPTMLVQGEADTLFDLNEAVANRAGISANGVPVKMVWIPGGHGALGAVNAGVKPARLESLAAVWFDRWLRGDTSADTGPPLLWYRASSKHFVGGSYPARSPGQPDGRSLGASPGAAGEEGGARTLYLSGDRRLTGQAGAAASGTLIFANPAGGQPAALSRDPTGGVFGSLPPLDIPGQNVAFETAPLPRALQVTGIPRLRLHLASSTGDMVAFVKLYDVAPDASLTLPGGLTAAIRPAASAAGQDVTVDLEGLAYRFDAGHRIRLVLAATDQAYANARAPAVYAVTLDRSDPATLVLPTAAIPAAGGHAAVYAVVIAAVLIAAAAVLLESRRRPAPRRMAAGAPAGPGPAAVTLSGLTKRFRGGLLAVDGLSLSIGAGQVFGLLGPNGAGKTTTIRMLLGLVYPTEGKAAIFGEPMRPGHPVLDRVGTLVEGPRFVPHLSGIDNLRLYWRAGRRRLSEANLEEALAVAELGEAIDRPVRTYSHGMRQRLGIAQALLGRPELLVLDEPTDGLDPQQMYEMRQLIRRLAGQGITVLLSSHLLGEVEQVCTHAAIMDRGRLVAAGTVAELVGASPTVYVEVDDSAAAARVLEGLAGPGGVRTEGTGLVVDLNGSRPSDVAAVLVRAGVGLE
ncbi:MAG TPA: alpha/beta fold hydrolase, partial [Actinomycetota bacterium]|nr:alpha/beta fold hydrolase [Actinomycetota bacterium]